VEALTVAAQRRCAALGAALTPARRRVFEILLAQRGPMKAYDLLDALRQEQANAKPPTVYRALDFLIAAGLVHRVESLNAFMACDGAHGDRPVLVMICASCGRALEAEPGHALHDLAEAAARVSFEIRQTILEAIGECAECRRPA
jgi:Fur family zinc uptake transcriptional regulator